MQKPATHSWTTLGVAVLRLPSCNLEENDDPGEVRDLVDTLLRAEMFSSLGITVKD